MRVAASGRTTTAFMHWLCCAFVFWFCGAVFASDALGLSWLQTQVRADGSLAHEGASAALPIQSRAEVATTLQGMAGTVPAALLNAIDQTSGTSVEILARKALAKQLTAPSTAYLDALAQQQNPDGGFGAQQGYASNVLDTAWALAAFTNEVNAYGGAVGQAIAWLIGAQQSDGQWRLAPDGDALVPTALAVQALQPYRQNVVVAAALSKARAWLLAERDSALVWGSSLRNAHALMAVLPGLAQAATVQAAVDALHTAQRPDGSWEGDPYVTALALRASVAASRPVTDPDLASVQGVLVSDATGQPLAGITVRLAISGRSTVTDAQGRFEFLQLNSGTDTLTVDAAGYLLLSADLGLLKGQRLDLGTIRLKARTVGNADTVTITGVARFTDDGASYRSAANATIAVNGRTAQTDANGVYALSGVAPGAITLKATYSSYQAVESSFSAQAGQQVRLDPVFRRGTAQSTLKVIVSSQTTGSSIAMATVSLNGVIRNTSAKGEAYFDTGVATGDNTVTVSASGHETRVIAMNVQGNRNITLPVALMPANVASTQTVLRGIVTDAATQLPLQGVLVAVDGTGRTDTTDAAGRYSIGGTPDIAGTRKVLFEKAGYQRHEQTITLVQNGTHQFDVPLQLSVDPQQPIAIEVTVADRTTHQPIGGATITLSGSNPNVLQTDAVGMAQASGLNAGVTQVQVSAPGYDNVALTVELAAGRRYRLPVDMTPRVAGQDRVHGMVLDAQTRQPLPGARVTLAGSALLEATAGANGRYEFTNIVPGRWNISATAPGHQGSSRGVDIAATTEIDLPLKADYGLEGGSTLRTVAVGHPNYTSGAVGYMFIFGAQGTTGQVLSNDGAINHGFTIDASGVAEVMVPSSQFLNTAGAVLDKAVLVYANKAVSASFLNREQYTTDMSYLLDTGALGTEYRVLTWPYSYSTVQFSLTAIEDGTVATVTPAGALLTGRPASIPFDVILNKGQSVMYTASSGIELTGTSIQANKPLAVFAGGQCANVPVNAGYCDHLFTQLPPVKHWAAQYVVPKTANTGSAGNLVRVLANVAGTQVQINGALVATLDPGQFHEVSNAGDLHIVASEPVLVGQFLKGSTVTAGGALGDPALTYVVGIDQTLADYALTAPTNLSPYQQNYLSIAIPTAALGSLQLNGAAVDVSAFAPVGASGYSAGQVSIPTGPGRIKATKPFVATISGFSRDDSYLTIIGAKYSSGASPVDIAARVTASTDKPSYPADSVVELRADVANQGTVPAHLQVMLRINDATGAEVARFAAHDLGEIAPGATAQHVQPWNTARYPAGGYTLIATLLNTKGEVVDVGSTLFTITAGAVPGSPKATLTVAVDRAVYAPDDRVRISSLSRNLTLNAALDDARVRITVRDPSNTVVYRYMHTNGQLTANAVRANDTQQTLKGAMLGKYTVEAVLIGSGNNLKTATLAGKQGKAYDVEVELASATATYEVKVGAIGGPGNPGVPGAPGAPGAVSAVPIDQPWFLWLMAVGLAWVARRRLRPGAQQTPSGPLAH